MYSYPLYRPPSEGKSLIIQVTEGCSHNKCAFCYMYKEKKFRVKTEKEILDHIKALRSQYKYVKRIFIADGDFLALNTEKILAILDMIKLNFEGYERISAYAGPLNILGKSLEELNQIRESGLDFLYLGVESGSDKVLKQMNKGVDQVQMREAAIKIKSAGMKLSCMIISGLGGRDYSLEHAEDSAWLISQIRPDYLSLLTLLVEEKTELADMLLKGEFTILKPYELMEEILVFLENIELKDTVFRSNHPSNYLNLRGILNKDKSRLINEIKKHIDENSYKSENYRLL